MYRGFFSAGEIPCNALFCDISALVDFESPYTDLSPPIQEKRNKVNVGPVVPRIGTGF